MVRSKFDGIALVGLALFAFMLFKLFQDISRDWVFPLAVNAQTHESSFHSASLFEINFSGNASEDNNGLQDSDNLVSEVGAGSPLESAGDLHLVVAPPYDRYAITQGPHGFSYGHLAVDLSAGKGAEIKSPIHGWVAANFTDHYGNTTLILENSRYQVLILHGIYSVSEGETVEAGQLVGYESNQGNTVDAFGQSCRGRDCGYHIHLNIFDKLLGMNVNPLELFVK